MFIIPPWKRSWFVIYNGVKIPCFLYQTFCNEIFTYITNLVCYTYFHWLFNPECQHIFGKLIPTLIPTKEDDAATVEQKSHLASYLVANFKKLQDFTTQDVASLLSTIIKFVFPEISIFE
jgi:hypothetical protein